MIRCPRCGLRHTLATCPACDAPAPPPELTALSVNLPPGYQSLGVLGAGGFAVVVEARDVMGRRVALKLAAGAGGLPAALITREAEALRALEGSAVPRLYASGHLADGRPWLALELLAGPSLAARLAEAAAPVPEAPALAVALATALAEVHAAGWVHGDVKPENAMGSAAGLRLLDLGLARRRDAPGAAAAGAGTAEYLAPELVAGGGPTAASDVYAAGAVIYALLTGRPPFTGSDSEVRHAHRERRPPPPSQLAPVPSALEAVVTSCLAKEPAARPGDGGALLERLRAAAAERLTVAAAPAVPVAPPAAAAPPSQRRAVAAVLAEGGGDVVALRAAVERAGGALARADAGRFAVVLDAPGDANPLRAALRCAERLLAAGALTRARVAIVQATAVERPGAPARWAGADLSRDDAYPRAGDPEGICAGEDVAEAIPDLPFAPVAGRPGLLQLATDGRDRIPALTAARPGEPPLVGRGALLDRLDALCAGARLGEPAVAIVLGEPGHGKSRVAAEVARRAGARGDEVLGLRASGAGAGAGRGALGALLRATLGLPELDGTALPGGFEALTRALPPGLADGWPAIALALGMLPPSAPEVRRLAAAPGALGGYQARVLAEVLRRRAAARPLVVVLDDAHLAEPALLDGLELAALAEARGRVAVVLAGDPALATARPALGARAAASAVERVPPLAGPDAAALCEALLRPVEHVPARAIDALVARAGGVPLLLGELVRALRQQGVVRRAPAGGWTLATDELERELATPLAAWLAERELAALPGDVSAHAQLVALLGEDARLEEVTGVLAELEREGAGAAFPLDAGAAQRRLVELGVLVVRGGAVAFRTPLARECVERGAGPARVALVHRAAYRFYARPGAVEEARRLPRLARHAAGCGERELASAITLGLAEDRAARQAYLEAEALFSRTLELAPAEARERRLGALRGRGLMRIRLGREREAAADLGAAAERAGAAGDATFQAECLLDAAIALDWLNDYDGAALLAAEAVRAAAGGGGPLLRARVALALGRAAYRQARWTEAAARLEESARAAEALGDEGYETRVISLALLAWLLPMTGRLEQAEEAAGRAIALARERGDLLHLAGALNNRQPIRLAHRDLDGALADLEEYRRLGRELGIASIEHAGLHNVGELLCQAGRLGEAEAWARRAVELEARRPELAAFPFGWLLLARVLVRAGALEEARAALAPVQRTLAAGGVRGPSWALLAEVMALAAAPAEVAGDPAAWDTLVARAASDSTDQERVEVLELRALSAARAGRREEARAALAGARALAARVGGVMAPRLEAAAAEIG